MLVGSWAHWPIYILVARSEGIHIRKHMKETYFRWNFYLTQKVGSLLKRKNIFACHLLFLCLSDTKARVGYAKLYWVLKKIICIEWSIDHLQIKIGSMCHFNSQGGSRGIKILIDQYIYMIKNTALISANWSSGPRTAFDLLSDLRQIN